MRTMPRVNRILQHQSYEDYCAKNKLAEANRVYCRHGSDHGLTVARVAYIYLLEKGLPAGDQEAIGKEYIAEFREENGLLNKEIIYAAGILHDIGRWVEYETQEDHAQASARLATPILRDCGFSESEIETITLGILEHRLKPQQARSLLGQALALADDWARDCKNCPSQSTCYKYTKAMEEILI